jgi:hypothetical protein
MRQLLEEIVRPQHHRSFSLDWPFEELTRCSLFNRIAQPHNLIYSLLCLQRAPIGFSRTVMIVANQHRAGLELTPGEPP